MLIYLFDNTFDGLLTAVFDAFFRHDEPGQLLTGGDALPLFADEVHEVKTDENKAGRVWAGLEKRLRENELRMITISWLSEDKNLNWPLFRYVCKVFHAPQDEACRIVQNFADEDVLTVTRIAEKVAHEAHRMLQFVRFQKAKDGTYLGVVSPDYNVLPLATDHFCDRFGDQPWLLYDAGRRYGFYYDTRSLHRIVFDGDENFDLRDGSLQGDMLAEDEMLFQNLWRTYFKAICIKERINPKKQAGDMPRRYWRYMTEMQKKPGSV